MNVIDHTKSSRTPASPEAAITELRIEAALGDGRNFAGPGVGPTPLPPRKGRIVLGAIATLSFAAMGVWIAAPQVRPAVALAAQATGAGIEGAIAAAASRLLGKPATNMALPTRGVRVMRVSPAPAFEERAFTGVVAARFETPLAFRVGGRIATRLVDVGASVQAGTPLLGLDPADYEIALRAARARLSAAQALQQQANAEDGRQKALLERGWTTRSAYDRAIAASRIADDQAAVAVEDVKLAQNRLSYTMLTAPHDGIVTGLASEAGQVVAEGQPALTLARPEEREAVVSIPEGQLAGLSSWSARARLWGSDAPDMTARLREMSPQADAASRTFRVRFALASGARAPDLGATITVHLRRALDEPGFPVPAAAIDMRNDQPRVWVVNEAGDRASPRPIAIVVLGSVQARVTGLVDGERVVTLGVHRLDAELPIRVIEETSAAMARIDDAPRTTAMPSP